MVELPIDVAAGLIANECKRGGEYCIAALEAIGAPREVYAVLNGSRGYVILESLRDAAREVVERLGYKVCYGQNTGGARLAVVDMNRAKPTLKDLISLGRVYAKAQVDLQFGGKASELSWRPLLVPHMPSTSYFKCDGETLNMVGPVEVATLAMGIIGHMILARAKIKTTASYVIPLPKAFLAPTFEVARGLEGVKDLYRALVLALAVIPYSLLDGDSRVYTLIRGLMEESGFKPPSDVDHSLRQAKMALDAGSLKQVVRHAGDVVKRTVSRVGDKSIMFVGPILVVSASRKDWLVSGVDGVVATSMNIRIMGKALNVADVIRAT